MIDIRPDLSSYSRGAQLRWTYGNTRGATYLMLKAINAGGPNAENTAWCRVQLADIYFKTGSLVAAKQQYNIALQQIPGYRHALVGLGRVRAAQGNLNEAIRLFNQATLGPTQITYVVELGDLYKKAGKNEDAEKQYARVDGLAKEHLAYGIEGDELVLAMFYLDHDRNLDKALSMADAEVKEGHKSVQAYSTQAWAYYKLKRYEEAAQTIKNAMRTNIRDATLFYRAGKIYQALGDQKNAKNYMLMAVSLNPSFHIFYADDAISSMKYAVNGKQQ